MPQVQTPTYLVDKRWLPKHMERFVWTDFTDATLIEKGTVFFDHQPWAMYAGEVIGFGQRNDHILVIVRWYKTPDNIFDEAYTHVQLEHARLYWADPVMQ